MTQKVVLALGGNAILQPGQEGRFEIQKNNIETSAQSITELINAGFDVAIVHGNGPQVGQILQQNEISKDFVPQQPLDACSAQSQGYIGYMLQQALKNNLPDKNVVTLLTMTEVSADDAAFNQPTKPIGTFYTQEQADVLAREKSWVMGEDAGRGYRRLVASPQPQSIVERETVKTLLESGNVVISTGGGGIPVIKNSENRYEGIAAVIDKDRSALQLALDIKADILMILTDVPNVYINYGKENQQMLETISIVEAEQHLADGQFSAGSMGPKVEACIAFAKQGGAAIICSLDKAIEAVQGNSGTRIS